MVHVDRLDSGRTEELKPIKFNTAEPSTIKTTNNKAERMNLFLSIDLLAKRMQLERYQVFLAEK